MPKNINLIIIIIIVGTVGCWIYQSGLIYEGANKIQEACISSGGEVSTSMCCKSANDFPNLCLIGPCGCSPENSHEIKICDCGEGKCFDGKKCTKIPSKRIVIGNDPLNSTYIINNESVTLQDGYSEQEIAPGSATKIKTMVFGEPVAGDLNGDDVNDAALVLTYDPGGSGTFYYIAAAIKTSDGYMGTNAILIGDRIAPQVTQINEGIVSHNYADRMPWEPFSADPSVWKTKYLMLENNELKETPREQLSQDTAVSLVEENWGGCGPDICDKLTVNRLDGKDGIWFVEAVYEGQKDDSVKDLKKIAYAHYIGENWVLGEIVLQEYICQLGRGQQEFSSELCL